MKRSLLLCLFLLIDLSRPISAQQTYEPPKAAAAGDAYVPYQIVVDGLFVLDVSLDDGGGVSRIHALRDPGSMLGAAKTSIRGWKFQPASRGGKPEPSRITVSFVYRPPNHGGARAAPPRDFSPVLPPDEPGSRVHGDYVPVGILSFAYPDYPVNSVAWGSVVVQLTVDKSGEITGVDFLHGLAGFNNFVSDALKKWRFQAATLNNKTIASKTVIAFIFQTPSSN